MYCIKGTIVISDLSVDDKREVEPIQLAAMKAKTCGWSIVWLDHHFWTKDVVELVQSFANLILSKDDEQKCAAELVYEVFAKSRDACKSIANFAHAIDFRLPIVSSLPPLPEIIRYYLTLPSAYKKLQLIIEKASKGTFWDDELQADYENKYLPLKESAMLQAMNSLSIHNISNYRIAIAEAPRILSKSILAEAIFAKEIDMDIVFLFAPDGKVSIRRRPDSTITRCDIIAKKMGVGGHSYAAAGIIKAGNGTNVNRKKIQTEDVLKILQYILNDI